MDNKRRLKKPLKRNAASSGSTTPVRGLCVNNNLALNEISEVDDLPDNAISHDSLYSIGYDWSSRRTKKPAVRIVDRPVSEKVKIDAAVCYQPRRLISSYDPDGVDSSCLFEQLKSLSSGFTCVPETNSPVASPTQPSFRRRDVLSTPTSVTVSSVASCSSPVVQSENDAKSGNGRSCAEDVKEDLADLLDDSLGADLLQFTQDIELSLKQKELKTPKHQRVEQISATSSKRKHRLSLCSKVHNSSDNEPIRPAGKETEMKQDQQKNIRDLTNFETDDVDEETLLSLVEIEENKLKETEISSPLESDSNGPSVTNCKTNLKNALEDDDFVAPEELSILDIMERHHREKEKLIEDSMKLKNSAEDDDFVAPEEWSILDAIEMKEREKKKLKDDNERMKNVADLGIGGFSKAIGSVNVAGDDDFISPEELSILDRIEMKDEARKKNMKEDNHNQRMKGLADSSCLPNKNSAMSLGSSSRSNGTVNVLEDHDFISPEELTFLDRIEMKDEAQKKRKKVEEETCKENHPQSGESIGSGKEVSKCTPREIEKKRQEALRKRLQLKRRQN